MPSRKQRRRRAKERRHEYEFVYVDDEGHEVAAEDPGRENGDRDRTNGKRSASDARKPARPKAQARPGRKIEPPSWQRVARRALIFAPFMFITVTLLNRGGGVQPAVFTTMLMLVMFVPFSYLTDRALYRRYVRQAGGAAPPPARRR
jgi:hypothetical protein